MFNFAIKSFITFRVSLCDSVPNDATNLFGRSIDRIAIRQRVESLVPIFEWALLVEQQGSVLSRGRHLSSSTCCRTFVGHQCKLRNQQTDSLNIVNDNL